MTDPTDGVTVVVDFTDVGGDVEVGFAPGTPGTGREALEAAGFVPTDSMPGMICAIDAHPDPCPEEFEGEFWSYWSGADDEWVAHTEGADGIDPAPGDIEGWRYNDGSTGPQITPAEAAEQVAAGEAGTGGNDSETDDGAAEDGTDDDAAGDDSAADDATDDAATDDAAEEEAAADDQAADGTAAQDDSGLGAGWMIALIVIVLAVLAALVMWVRRARGADASEASEDGEPMPRDR